MADVLRKTDRFVVLSLRVSRDDFDLLTNSYASEGKALGVLRQEMPHVLQQLIERRAEDLATRERWRT
jgi:hypothetical protein